LSWSWWYRSPSRKVNENVSYFWTMI
jgi:hypothetical protein